MVTTNDIDLVPISAEERAFILKLSKWSGVDFDTMPVSNSLREEMIRYTFRAFDYYTSKGNDFSCIAVALKDMFSAVATAYEEAHGTTTDTL